MPTDSNDVPDTPLEVPTNSTDLGRAIDAVLIELADILKDYGSSFVVSGGLAMRILFGDSPAIQGVEQRPAEIAEPFDRDTKDVDFVLNLFQIDRDFDDQSETIGELLTQNSYYPETPKQYWAKTVNLPGFAAPVRVPVEFLAPHRFSSKADAPLLQTLSEIQEVRPVPLSGVDLALLQPRRVLLSGQTPGEDYLTDVPVQVVDPAMLILIKAIAFADRLKKQDRNLINNNDRDHAGKHAYDISELLYRYPGRISALAERLLPPYLTKPSSEQPTISDAIEILRAHFADRDSHGIRLMIQSGGDRYGSDDEKQLAQQRTVSLVNRLLQMLDDKAEEIY